MYDHAHVLVVFQIAVNGQTVADRLDIFLFVHRNDGRIIFSVCKSRKITSPLAEDAHKQGFLCRGKLPDRLDPEFMKFLLGRTPHIEQFFRRQRPNGLFIIFLRDFGHGVGFFHIRAELGKNLVPAHADAHRDADLLFHPFAYRMGDLRAAAEQKQTLRNVEPTFVDTERLDTVGIILVDFTHFFGNFEILREIRLHFHKLAAAFLPRFPIDVARLYARALGDHVFGEHDAVPIFLRPHDHHGFLADFGTAQTFHRGVKIIQIAVQNRPHTQAVCAKTDKPMNGFLLFHCAKRLKNA